MRLVSSTIALGLLAIAVSMPSVQPASAQNTPESDWSVTCEETRCSVSISATDTRTGQRVATIMIILDREEQSPLMAAIVPLGVAIEPGLRMLYGDEVVSLGVEACFPDGCRAVMQMNDAFHANLARAEDFELRYFPLGSEQPVAVTLPSDGLTDTLAEAQKVLEK